MTTATNHHLVVRLPTRGRTFPVTLKRLADGGRLVKVDRSTPWGNPFVLGVHGDRDQVVDLHAAWLNGKTGTDVMPVGTRGRTVDRRWVLEHVHELRGMALACHCAPSRCHGDILARRANGE